MIFTTLGKLITDLTHTVSQLSGPVGIYTVTAQVTQSGSISTLLSLTALLSTNIGMFNLLPIPGLDGSQVLFALVEKNYSSRNSNKNEICFTNGRTNSCFWPNDFCNYK